MHRKKLSRIRRPAPFRGAGLLPLLILLAAVGGCRGSEGGAEDRDAEDARALGLPPGAQLHRISLGGRGAEEHAIPTSIRALPGDGVEFRTVDHRGHTLTFVADSLTLEVHAFLEATGQMASPPLVSLGNRFIVRLQNAPHGRYLYVSEGHGGVAWGVVEVGPPSETDSSQTSRR